MSARSLAVRAPGAFLAVCLATVPSSFAADCPGDSGYGLDIDPELVPIGTAFQVTVTAPPGSLVVLLLSPTPGPIATPYGELCVGAPFATFPFVTPVASLTFPHFVACEPSFVGLQGSFQYLAASPGFLGQVFKSNSQSITIVDGQCTSIPEPGDYASFTQGGWGQNCNGQNVGCLRDAHFDSVFPAGLVLGDADGIDGDGHYAIVLSSSSAVNAFLPAGGTPSALTSDHSNPGGTEAGVFAGQLAAAKLNVAYDAAGAFDHLKSGPGAPLGDLVFVANVHPALLQKTVLEVIQLSDLVLSGAVAAPVDVDGQPVSISDLSTALDRVNNEFGGGSSANGSLGVFHAGP